MNTDNANIYGMVKIDDSEDGKDTDVPTTEPMTRLASYILSVFRVNRESRRQSGVDSHLIYALKAQAGEYNDEQKAKLIAAGMDPKVFTPVTSTKIRAAKAMLNDIFSSAGDRPWTISPTPDPDLPDEILSDVEKKVALQIVDTFDTLQKMNINRLNAPQVGMLYEMIVKKVSDVYDEVSNEKDKIAHIRASRMEKKIHDTMIEGGWIRAFAEYVNNICVFGTGLIVGPIIKTEDRNDFTKTELGTTTVKRVYKKVPTFEAINPLDCYPAPDARYVDEGPLCIRVKYTSNVLWKYVQKASVPEGYDETVADGWFPGTVIKLLARYPDGGIKIDFDEMDIERRLAEQKTSSTLNDCVNEGIRCFSSVRGSFLLEEGITKTPEGKKINRSDYYNIDAIVIGGFVVYCRILDERMGRPVSKGVFYERPGSWWGESIADKLYSCQNVMNNAVKNLLQNMAAASGPMFWMQDLNRIIDRDRSGFKIKPFKVWTFQNSMMGNSGAPMGVMQVPSNINDLLSVFEKMRQQSDEDSGIPAYTYGQTGGQSGALRTAGGLQIFTEAASRGMKMVISTTDRLVTRDQVYKTFLYIMLYDTDMDIKGDIEVIPHGVMGRIMKAQQDQQRLQLFNMVINNQYLLQMVGPKGIAVLFRPSIRDVAINPDDVIPGDDKLDVMDMLEKIKAIGQASMALQASQNPSAQQQPQMESQDGGGGGMAENVSSNVQPPGVEKIENFAPKGGVEERRGVA